MPNLKRQWTVADRDDLPDDGNRYEVIDGELFVSPAPSMRHQRAVLQLARLLADYLDQHQTGGVYVAPADVIFSQRRGVQPDVFIVPLVNGRQPEDFDEVRRLLLAVEVLSPSTARADRVAKRTLFREESVPEYWIVDLDARMIERSTPSEPRPELFAERIEWVPPGASEPLVIDLVAYFERVLDR
ncbi:MAG: Uma2 family endonuclease [Gemmatimonadaceae bacterium]